MIEAIITTVYILAAIGSLIGVIYWITGKFIDSPIDRWGSTALLTMVTIGLFLAVLAMQSPADPSSQLPQTPYRYCADKAQSVFDQFNDTVGSSYALTDTPSVNITAFIDHCMENYE